MKKDFYDNVNRFVERQIVKFATWQSRRLISLAQVNYEYIMRVGLAIHNIKKYGTIDPSMEQLYGGRYDWAWHGNQRATRNEGVIELGIDNGDGTIDVNPDKTIKKEIKHYGKGN